MKAGSSNFKRAVTESRHRRRTRETTLSLQDMLTPAQIKQATAIFVKTRPEKYNSVLVDVIIAPHLDQINKRLGGNVAHSATFIAYCVEYCLMKRKHKRPAGQPFDNDDGYTLRGNEKHDREDQEIQEGY